MHTICYNYHIEQCRIRVVKLRVTLLENFCSVILLSYLPFLLIKIFFCHSLDQVTFYFSFPLVVERPITVFNAQCKKRNTLQSHRPT